MCEMSLLNFNFLSCSKSEISIPLSENQISLAFSEIMRAYQYSFFIFVRLAYMLNCYFLFCSITDIYIYMYPLLRLLLHITKSFKHCNNN